MYEVELKAWDRTPDETRQRLARFARYECTATKSDEYFRQQTEPFVGVRIRTQSKTAADGERKNEVLVTHKSKTFSGGVEINDETEFAVSDGKAFAKLLGALGLKIERRKRKECESWLCGGYHIELVRAEGIGRFVEIETLIESNDAESVSRAKGGLMEILAKCGIDEREIEPRTYAELLGLCVDKP